MSTPLQKNSVERLAYDSTTITHAMRCAKFSFLEDSLKFIRTYPKEQLNFDFGSAFHFILQVYLQDEKSGEASARAYLDGHGADPVKQKEINDLELRDSKRNIKSLRLMFSKFLVDDKLSYKFKTFKQTQPMIEYRLGFPIEVEDRYYFFGGYIDRVVEFDGKMVPLDFKTTGKPNLQYATQAFQNVLAADMYLKGLQINFGIDQVKKTFIFHLVGLPMSNSSVNSHVEIVHVEQERLDQALSNVKRVIAQQGKFARDFDASKDIQAFPMNHASCYACKYSNFCRKPLTEQNKAIEYHMKTPYTATLWNPLTER